MKAEAFARIKGISLEIHSLIRQGVKDGINERIDQRNTLLQEWMADVNHEMNTAQEQQLFLEHLLAEEQSLLAQLEQEQKDIQQGVRGRQKLSQYQNIADH